MLLDSEHPNVTDDFAKPRMRLLHSLDSHHASNRRDVLVAKIDASLLARKSVTLKHASDIIIPVRVSVSGIMPLQRFLVEVETDGVHTPPANRISRPSAIMPDSEETG
jgi:hypothetical protein